MSKLMKFRHTKLVILALLVLVGLTIFWLYSQKKPSKNMIPSKTTALNSQPRELTPATGIGRDVSDKQQLSGSPGDDSAIITPTGAFVSNHRPSLSGSVQQLDEQSVCNTSPAIKCYIRFSKGSEVKTLDTQTTDANGSALWSWNIKSSGLSAGTWTVEAVASNNSDSKTATDPINLVISP